MTTKAAKLQPKQTATSSPDLSWYTADRQQRKLSIQQLCERIAGEFKPEKIILFGSQANETASAESDVDLLVVMPYTGSPLRQAGEILRRLQAWLPIDLIVRSAEEIEQRLKQDDRFTRNILEGGKVMYEAANR